MDRRHRRGRHPQWRLQARARLRKLPCPARPKSDAPAYRGPRDLERLGHEGPMDPRPRDRPRIRSTRSTGRKPPGHPAENPGSRWQAVEIDAFAAEEDLRRRPGAGEVGHRRRRRVHRATGARERRPCRERWSRRRGGFRFAGDRPQGRSTVRAAGPAVATDRLPVPVHGVNDDSARPCGQSGCSLVAIPPVGRQPSGRSCTRRRHAPRMRMPLNSRKVGCRLSPCRRMGFGHFFAATCAPGSAARRAGQAGAIESWCPSFFRIPCIFPENMGRLESSMAGQVSGSPAPCPTAIGTRTATGRPGALP